MENRKTTEDQRNQKSFFENIHKTDKSSARKKKREKTQITKIRNEDVVP